MIEDLLKELIATIKENNDLLKTGLQLSAKPAPVKRSKKEPEAPAAEPEPAAAEPAPEPEPEAPTASPEPAADDSAEPVSDTDDLMPIRAAHRRKSASAKHLPDFTTAYKALCAKHGIAKLPELKTKGDARAFLADLEAVEIETK